MLKTDEFQLIQDKVEVPIMSSDIKAYDSATREMRESDSTKKYEDMTSHNEDDWIGAFYDPFCPNFQDVMSS